MADTKLIIDNINDEEGIAWLTLNRPEKKNALSIALLNELASILRSIRDNEKIRCIVTMGGGDAYSSGRDLYDMRTQGNRRGSRDVFLFPVPLAQLRQPVAGRGAHVPALVRLHG